MASALHWIARLARSPALSTCRLLVPTAGPRSAALHTSRKCLGDKVYTEKHEWIVREGTNARIGISDYAQKELGDVVFVELPMVGTKMAQGDALATIESVKAVGDVNAPISGKVIEVNELLEGSPATVNQSPEDEGWLVVMEIENEGELDGCMTAEKYSEFVGEAE